MGQVNARGDGEAVLLGRGVDVINVQHGGHGIEIHIATLRDGLHQVERAMSGRFVAPEIAAVEILVARAVDDRVRRDDALLQARQGDQQLEQRKRSFWNLALGGKELAVDLDGELAHHPDLNRQEPGVRHRPAHRGWKSAHSDHLEREIGLDTQCEHLGAQRGHRGATPPRKVDEAALAP
ncbi:hypothetical protein GALL_416610 [mine drainage metagenome]|uniref:Uncharacterized protein n=1 Tax=mine drainage metagenome TaxID=410659 RepID=A0A1J5QKV3_9ZZZZ